MVPCAFISAAAKPSPSWMDCLLFYFHLSDCKGRLNPSFSLCKRYLVGDAIHRPMSCTLCSWGPSQEWSRCGSGSQRNHSIPQAGQGDGSCPALGWGTLLCLWCSSCVKALFFPQKRQWDGWVCPCAVDDVGWCQLGLCHPVPVTTQ